MKPLVTSVDWRGYPMLVVLHDEFPVAECGFLNGRLIAAASLDPWLTVTGVTARRSGWVSHFTLWFGERFAYRGNVADRVFLHRGSEVSLTVPVELSAFGGPEG